MLDGEFPISDYKNMTAELETELNSFTAKKTNQSDTNSEKDRFLLFCSEHIETLRDAYAEGNVREKQLLLGSIFEENLIFDENKCRTPKFNKVISLLFTIYKGFRRKKNGIEPLKFVQSRKVEARLQKSNFFIEDMERIEQISLSK